MIIFLIVKVPLVEMESQFSRKKILRKTKKIENFLEFSFSWFDILISD